MEATIKQIEFAKKLGIDNPEQYDKFELSKVIEANKPAPKADYKPKETKVDYDMYLPKEPTANKHQTMYVSYAKDLVVAGKSIEEAIAIINKAKDAFE